MEQLERIESKLCAMRKMDGSFVEFMIDLMDEMQLIFWRWLYMVA